MLEIKKSHLKPQFRPKIQKIGYMTYGQTLPSEVKKKFKSKNFPSLKRFRAEKVPRSKKFQA